jgi:AcrR family transcriptional regulator
MTPGGLRERNKARTRDEIIDAALTLFETKGYDATTCEDIAAAVDISTRTFFRYFDTKLDVVMAAKGGEHRYQDIPTLLCARPPEEPPIEALRAVLRELLDELEVADSASTRQYFVMMETPSLRALQLEHFHDAESALAVGFAPRLGCEPCDLMARTLGAAACAAVRTSVDQWMSTGAEPGQLWPIIDESLGLLTRGFGSV